MIQIICGEKGSGKTKKILDSANERAKTSKGTVVFLDKDDSHKLALSYQVRLNDMSEYHIASDKELVSFIKGMLATNYDITDVYIDGIVKITGHPVDELGGFFADLDQVVKGRDVTFILTISRDAAKLPEFLKGYKQI